MEIALFTLTFHVRGDMTTHRSFVSAPSGNIEHSFFLRGEIPSGIEPGVKHLVGNLHFELQKPSKDGSLEFVFSFVFDGSLFQVCGEDYQIIAAGAAVNMAYVLRSFGLDCPSIMIPIGEDLDGKRIERRLKEDDFCLYPLPAERTSTTLAVRDREGNTTLFCEKFPSTFQLDTYMLFSRRIPLDSIMLFGGVKPSDVQMLFFLIENKDILDFSRVYAFMPHASLLSDDRCGTLIRRSHVTQINEHEYEMLMGHPFDPEDTKKVAELKGYGNLIVTAGERGAYLIFQNGDIVHQPAFLVSPRDTCGAGDTHLATFVHYAYRDLEDPLDILEGRTRLREHAALNMAAWVASQTVKHVGPYTGIPDAEICEAKWQSILAEFERDALANIA